ncbi:MAG: flagellar hook-associated protein FlgK [Desulfobacteraceae bacterium]|jgi:flagellar hook-associated protein 1 FlgK
MSGIGLVLNIAKDALLSQQYAINVISHNIANVGTDGYSRQVALFEAKGAAPYGGLIFGRGVQVSDIIRTTNEFIENRLQTATSDLSMMSENETYMKVIESIFNENSGNSLSNQFNEFWNAWADVNNNPSGNNNPTGMSVRNILAEYGSLLSQSFQDISGDLSDLNKGLNNSISAGVDTVNQILEQIADINGQILHVKITGNPNDLLDQRNMLLNKLSEYMDINTFESEDGSISITTSKGFALVNKRDSYLLNFDGKDINWKDGTSSMTDGLQGGKLGAWLDLRDEVIPDYLANLDEIAKSTIWEINKLHSQGVGLSGFSSVEGTYKSTDPLAAMGSSASGLDFSDKITDGSFKLWLYDSTGAVVGEATIPVDAGTTTMSDLASTINGLSINGEDALNASIKDGALNIEIDSTTHPGYTFAFSDDDSNILAALGINTFFTDSTASNMGVNNKILSDKGFINAGTISNNVDNPVGAATNSSTGILTASGQYTGTTDGSFEIEIRAGGNFRWRKDSGAWSADIAIAGTHAIAEGVEITFNGVVGDYSAGDTFTINVTESSDTNGEFFPGDNSNSLKILELQHSNVTVKQWNYSRTDGTTSKDLSNTTLDGYLHQMIGRIGIESQSVQRQKEYTQAIQGQLSETRDNMSAVSLDEEMANLIKFQQAYAAAAKLITTAEEMLEQIINTV